MSLSLDEAIRHAEEVAEENYGKANAYLSDREVYKHEEQKCLKCADEHMQLAEWLKDYKRLLSAEKTGHWNFIGDQMFECSECKHIFTQRQLESWRTYTYESEFPNYCPNCGARMVEPQESEG